jgi:hypothetical protein
MAMMDPPSSFYFENIKAKHKKNFFYKIGDQGKVIKFSRKEMQQFV